MNDACHPVGNEFVSLPVVGADAAVGCVNVLHMGLNGLLSFDGGETPFLRPFVSAEGKPLLAGKTLAWDREADWVPRFRHQEEGVSIEGSYFAPPEGRGFVLRLEAQNRSSRSVKVEAAVGLHWAGVRHSVNETKTLEGARVVIPRAWDGVPVLEYRAPEPKLALAVQTDGETEAVLEVDGQVSRHNGTAERDPREIPVRQGATVRLSTAASVPAGASQAFHFYVGMGGDEVAAVTSAREFKRRGGRALREETLAWLESRRRTLPGEHAPLSRLMNLNAFFNLFFASGLTLDTEEWVCLTSRSPRYYVSGAYWDRDALLWSFPSILELDPARAREVLRAVFVRQRRNFGVHSRTLTGTVLEPGFELDALCAPVIALKRYVDATKDRFFLDLPEVKEGIETVLERLGDQRHPRTALYRTWLLPSDDPWPHRYVTYDNVLVWRTLLDLSGLLGRREASALKREAERVRKAVREHCIVKGEHGDQYAFSVDLEGKHLLYDEPPGSLQLLPFHGFCTVKDPAWRATLEWLHSAKNPLSFKGAPFEETGCGHAKHPWVLSAANSLLAGETARAVRFLSRAVLDNGVACESVDEKTGTCATGRAFATCAGFLAFAMWEALGKGAAAPAAAPAPSPAPGKPPRRRKGDPPAQGQEEIRFWPGGLR